MPAKPFPDQGHPACTKAFVAYVRETAGRAARDVVAGQHAVTSLVTIEGTFNGQLYRVEARPREHAKVHGVSSRRRA